VGEFRLSRHATVGQAVADSTAQGPDPLLTAEGEKQVHRTRKAWDKQIQDRIPLPQVLYSSPLRRAIDTVELTWNDSSLDTDTPRMVSICTSVSQCQAERP
jgi:broad specificity phosphatase PhoE